MKLTLRRPDDWHLHLRDGDMLAAVLPHTAARFARAIVMPNLAPPVTTTAAALAYRERILAALPAGSDFEPLMTLYLTDNTLAEEIHRAAASGAVFGVKLYPAGATTNSDSGVTHLRHCDAVLAAMEEAGMVLQVHGEVTAPGIDVFDRERVFIERVLAPAVERFPQLKVVFEHVTTADAVEFVRGARDGIAATVTPQHMLLNRNALFAGGLRPHHYCLPVLKAERHREAVLAAATSGSARFFLGTDSAPHTRGSKESSCGCAGIYSAPVGIEIYAEAFEQAGALDRLEAFASEHGARFYGLPLNDTTITLERRDWMPPAEYAAGADTLVPFRAGETVRWQLVAA
ncbi:dihydroorotase [Thioalkalivibrio sp. XN279]|uniref:dihydroorotase n=1 Tax=Thioalkalivibrio sp. XN279 TaxID=2714953 RepID=UPI00140C293A|nr:dihydroorotase [Thioalkalivibrio sp. XN279]NHA14860.1 dihydroorotase [Thioalkalivibrio sp. XN279]